MLKLVIDGCAHEFDCAAETPLLMAIHGAGLGAVPRGCLIGMCGACTVHLDGLAELACRVSVEQAQGRAITTFEGLLDGRLGRTLAQAWTRHAVSPCGHCGPGQIMAAAALLARNPAPGDDEIDAALAGHVCDCDERGDPHLAVHEAARALVRDAAS